MATHERPEELLERCGLSVVEERTLPGRQGRYNPVPSGLESTLRELLTGQYPEGLSPGTRGSPAGWTSLRTPSSPAATSSPASSTRSSSAAFRRSPESSSTAAAPTR